MRRSVRPPRSGPPLSGGTGADLVRAVAVLAVLVTASLALLLAGPRAARRPDRGARAPVPARTVAAAHRSRSGARLPAPAGDLLAPGPLATALAALQADYVGVVRAIEPSVVQLTTASDLGSGVVFDARGDIVTNDHVVGAARRVTVTLADGQVLAGRVVGTDRGADLAVVRVHARGLRPAHFAGAGAAQAGAIVLAIGNPLGFQSSVSVGVVSAVGRRVTEPDGVTLTGIVQTSAEINPGNSGGALVDLAGEVVGIPTLVALNQQTTAEAPGIGFAVPAADVIAVARQLIRTGRVTAAAPDLLGMSGGNVVGPQGAALGVLVTAVRPGSPMAVAGLRAQEIVVAAAGHPVLTTAQLADTLAAARPGAAVPVAVLTPGGRRLDLAVRRPAGHG